MSWLFTSGRVADLVIALALFEGIALAAWHRRTGRGVAGSDIAANLAAGICLVLAVRFALVGAAWGWIAVCLIGSLVAHVADLRRRWRGL